MLPHKVMKNMNSYVPLIIVVTLNIFCNVNFEKNSFFLPFDFIWSYLFIYVYK